MSYIQHGTSAFRKTSLALFAGGFNTFAILYYTQPLMPEFSKEFGISPVTASLSLSLTTLVLAISMIIVGSLSESWGRKPIMTVAMVTASVLTLITAFAPNFHTLLVFRIFLGAVLAGLPAIAMAYLGEEIAPASLGAVMGLYISGNSIGGMGGRVITGALTDLWNWRIAIAAIGFLGLILSIVFMILLPPSRHFEARPLRFKSLLRSLGNQFKDPGLLILYALGFLLMGSFVSLYNYIGYQLIAPPYSLSQTLVGFIFIVYIAGTFSSTWMGRMADTHGRPFMLWMGLMIFLCGALLTLSPLLVIKIAGIIIFTFGFFGSHSIASSWIGIRAVHEKAQASSLYLFFYYAGSSIGGTLGGIFWSSYGWHGVIGMIACFLTIALLLSLLLARLHRQQAAA
ncbi:MFS transporter [Paenibacillus dokdonensis]|uniref:MFS transporter n=1 Tax=Paenibacillus dokdonensis TaxID=2567944 RepID=A0ABU6GHJ8_9BACL|nr:MFS transporter [Paenibacillus dokdonensis]MEC0238903.1 MFS transporter [Paenibacillus dokdonensis]